MLCEKKSFYSIPFLDVHQHILLKSILKGWQETVLKLNITAADDLAIKRAIASAYLPNEHKNKAKFNPSGAECWILQETRPILWLLMPWLLVSPGHQPSWYWLCTTCNACVLWEWISTTCATSMLRNHRNAQIFYFSLKWIQHNRVNTCFDLWLHGNSAEKESFQANIKNAKLLVIKLRVQQYFFSNLAHL